MSEQVTFTGVTLKSFSRNKNGGKASFRANFTEIVARVMGWGGITEGQTSVEYTGSALASSNVVLQPKDGEFAKWTIEFAATSIKGFEAIRREMEGKRGKGHTYELHFTAEFVDVTACQMLEEFMTHIGDAKSTLKVSYTKQAEQTSMIDDTTLDEDRRQATLEAND